MLDQRIDANTRRFAVLGKLLGHTWSPVIHNSLFQAAKRNAIYLPITVDEAALPAVCDVFRSCFDGFNVTIPYKERILPLLDGMDDAARICGAVNTVENLDGRLIGHITDGLGMLQAIRERGISVEQAHVLVLGGGGAARVAAYEFLCQQCHVTIAVRNLEKGKQLTKELADTQADGMARIVVCPLTEIPGAFDLLVNCTPVGMFPEISHSPVGMDVVARCSSVFDAVYNPRETKLLSSAKSLRKPCVEGLGMLYHQAVEAQKIWFGSEIGLSQQDQQHIYRLLLDEIA